MTVVGTLERTRLEQVFMCMDCDRMTVMVAEEAPVCDCGSQMDNTGWFESGDDCD